MMDGLGATALPMVNNVVNNAISSVTDAYSNDSHRVEQLKIWLIKGWRVFDKMVEYQNRPGATALERDAMTSLIQKLYAVEDLLDKVAHRREDSKTFRTLQAILQSLGFSSTNPQKMLQHLAEKLDQLEKALPSETNPILRYSDMSSEVRRCLAYFSLFPDHYQFNVDYLVHLWVGECFVPLNHKRSSLKKIEEISVKILIEKSILQPLEDDSELYSFNNSDGEFANFAAAETCLHLDHCGPLASLDKKTRHLSLSSCHFNLKFWLKLKKLKLKLRTFLSLHTQNNPGHLEEIPLDIKDSLLVLRVLSLTGTNIKKLPNFICKLKQLRYIDVSFTNITVLPSKLHKNRALQLLKIKSTNNLLLWPKEFHKLTSLIYVDWDEAFIRKYGLPCEVGKLSHLENLPLFQIGTEDGYFIKELKEMNNLQGSIRIENLEKLEPENADRNAAEEAAKEVMLHTKCGLKRIALHWDRPYYSRACDEHILKGLQPCEDVKELKIEYYGGDNLPEWISDSRIEKVSLLECRDCYLSALGRMGNLKTLVLDGMENILEVSCHSDGDAHTGVCFPKLESMEFHNMIELEKWTGLEAHDDVLPSLKELKFVGCPTIDSSSFIEYLKPSTYILKDDECLRCNGGGTCNSSVACPHNQGWQELVAPLPPQDDQRYSLSWLQVCYSSYSRYFPKFPLIVLLLSVCVYVLLYWLQGFHFSALCLLYW